MKSSRVLTLLSVALLGASYSPQLSATEPAPNEIILYGGENFSGPQKSYRIEPYMHQRYVDLTGIDSFFADMRSFKAGSQVMVTGFLDKGGLLVGSGLRTGPSTVEGSNLEDVYGRELRTSSRLLHRGYSSLVMNHLGQMEADGQRRFDSLSSALDNGRLRNRHPLGVLFHHIDRGGFPVGANIEENTYVFLGEHHGVAPCTNLSFLFNPPMSVKVFGGGLGPSALSVTLWPESDCRGIGKTLPKDRWFFWLTDDPWSLGDQLQMAIRQAQDLVPTKLSGVRQVKSVEIHWKGPKLPDPPTTATTGGSRRAPEAPRQAPEAPDDPPGSPAQSGDEITRFRLVRRAGDLLHFEVDYRVSAAHGGTVYAGARLHESGRGFGGYLPVQLPSIGEGMVTIELALVGETAASDEVEFFLYEGGQPPFISRRFPFAHGPTAQILNPTAMGHDYRGCFKDAHQRDLQGFHLENSGMTVNLCLSTCKAGGFSVAAVQFGTHCFCGDSFGRYGPASNCDMPCGGDPSDTCGGSWANGVFGVR